MLSVHGIANCSVLHTLVSKNNFGKFSMIRCLAYAFTAIFKSNALAERWVRSVRNECLDHRLTLGHQHLQRTIHEYVDYYNRW